MTNLLFRDKITTLTGMAVSATEIEYLSTDALFRGAATPGARRFLLGEAMNIWRPCDNCIHKNDCDMFRGCWQWKTYFRAYWKELRKRWIRR